MRLECSATSISWIPSEAMTGPMRLPMDLGIGHYDEPPPDRLDDGDLEDLRAADRFRFANNLSAWIEVEDGRIVDAGYSGGGIVGSTTARLGLGSLTFAGVAYPVIQEPPQIDGTTVRFVQTAGGRTGSPLPHRSNRPPYLRITAPTAWTTLALTIGADASAAFEVVGASPFPRHWIYDNDGRLAAKSGVIDFAEWTHVHDHDRSPWHDVQRDAIVAAVESELERTMSREVMGSRPKLRKLGVGDPLTKQGEPGGDVYLVLDGMLEVDVDGEIVAEVGPGAIVGERAAVEQGIRTATLRATTPVRVAAISAQALAKQNLTDVARGHRREDD